MNKFHMIGIAAAISFANIAFAETYAICMGINDYPTPTDAQGNPFKDEKGEPVSNKLFGCVNDAKAYKTLFEAKFKVKPENVKLLLDKDVTSKGFLDAFKWVISKAKEGDQIFVQFSGHGSQIDNKEKVTGKQSVIVLQDMALVSSDFFKELGPTLRNAGISSTFVFDSCFAGGMSRLADTRDLLGNISGVNIPRMLVSSSRQRFTNYLTVRSSTPRSLAGQQLNNLKTLVKQTAPTTNTATTAYVFASSDMQTSADVRGAGMEARGIFSLLLTAVYSEAPTLPLGETVSEINAFLKSKEFEQTPATESSDDGSRLKLSLLP